MKVYIMRGIPGSGKSTWVNDLKNTVPKVRVCSADTYHIDPDGVYRFKIDRIADAHDFCLLNFATILAEYQKDNIITVVDNTNSRLWEIAPYYRLAEAYKAQPEIIWIHRNPAVAVKQGLHGVPENKVYEMAQSFDPLPPWWVVRHVGL
jgi:predicted kinase